MTLFPATVDSASARAFCAIALSSNRCFFGGWVSVSRPGFRFSVPGPIRPRERSRCGVAIAPATWRTRSRRAIPDTAPPRRMRGACRRHAMSHATWWGRHARRRGVRRTHSGPAGALVASALVLSRFFVSWLSHLLAIRPLSGLAPPCSSLRGPRSARLFPPRCSLGLQPPARSFAPVRLPALGPGAPGPVVLRVWPPFFAGSFCSRLSNEGKTPQIPG